MIEAKTKFGPLVAPKSSSSSGAQADNGMLNKHANLMAVEIMSKEGERVRFDLTDENRCNWICLIGLASCKQEQNCMIYQLSNDIYISTTRAIQPGEVLKAWYATGYARKFGLLEEPVPLSSEQQFTVFEAESQETSMKG